MKALILESSRLYRQLLENLLAQHGFDNDITDELKTARQLLAESAYDLLCLNQNLKDGTGLELVRECRADPRLKKIPILFFTSDPDLGKQLLEIGVDAIIPKTNLQQINDQIRHFIEHRLDPMLREGRILLVEDSESIANLIRHALEQKGFRIDHFTAADKAWETFIGEVSYGSDREAFDLVLTDIHVEGEMDGLELTRRIRHIDDARGFIPIIAITAETSNPELRLSLYREGINDFIPKPILIEELQLRVQNLIANKRLLDKVHDQRRELYEQATTDKLTGCHNRHSLTDYSRKLISQARRHRYPISLLVLDLDHFKQINDRHGHATGDRVLSEVGGLLNRSYRDSDLVARFGGEEFVILLSHCAPDDALRIAEKLRQAIQDLRPADIDISASIGVTTLEDDWDADFEAMFSAADKAVYRAKAQGRNQVVFQPLSAAADPQRSVQRR